MTKTPTFDLSHFLPYLLNQAADAQSDAFNPAYKRRYGMLRTEWRVLFHLGQYGDLTAKAICDKAQLHKTKVSRAVAALVQKRFVVRKEIASDRRQELLSLTAAGQRAYAELQAAARDFDAQIADRLGDADLQVLKRCLVQLAVRDGAR